MRISDQSRLILVEGLPGTGKTTLAQLIAADLRKRDPQVSLYLEGDLHPVDLQWIARMWPDEYESAVAELRDHWLRSARSEPWEAIEQRLNTNSVIQAGMVLTAYTKLDFRDTEMWQGLQHFRDREVHGARVDVKQYRDIYTRRWKKFADQYQRSERTFVFECAFFQSHITELLGHHLVNEEAIMKFLYGIIEPVLFMKPEIHYIRAGSYADRIRATGATRGGWLDDVISWVENSPYGKRRSLQGFDGMMSFFQHRAEIERTAMEHLGLPVNIIER